MKDYKVIDIRGKKIKVLMDDEGRICADAATDEEVADAILLNPESCNSKLQKITDDVTEELEQLIKRDLKKAVLKILGFEVDRWNDNRIEIDHCNGRMSEVTNYLAISVKDLLKKINLDDFTLTKKEIADIKKELRADLKERVRRDLYKMSHDIVNSVLKKITCEVESDIGDALTTKIRKAVIKKLTVIEDKESYATERET